MDARVRTDLQTTRPAEPAGLSHDGGDEGDRTLDLRIANATLSQLSYVPTLPAEASAPPPPQEFSALWRPTKAVGSALDALAIDGLVTEEDAPQVMRWFHDWVRYGFFERIVLG